MDNNIIPTPAKSLSFSKDRDSSSDHALSNGDSSPLVPNDPREVLHEVDRFLCSLQSDSPPPPQLPECVFLLPKFLDSRIEKYNTGSRHKTKFGQDPIEEKLFFEALDLLSRLCTTLSDFPDSNSLTSSTLDKTSSCLEKTMSFLGKELCFLLENNTRSNSYSDLTPKKSTKQFSSFNSSVQDADLGALSIQSESNSPSPDLEAEFPAFSSESISKMNKISNAMINAGYQLECCITFSNFRRHAFKVVLQSFGFVSISMEDIQKTQWESLETQISTWINVVRHCSTVLFPAERKFYDSVFPNEPTISQRLFSDLARCVIIRFLNFAEAIALEKRSVDKLFKFLDVYETLRDLEATIDECYEEKCGQEVAYEIANAKGTLGDAVVSMFLYDLENSIKNDNERIPVPNGSVHPLTRYMMNYLEYVCEYKDTLEQVIEQHVKKVEDKSTKTKVVEEDEEYGNTGLPSNTSAFAIQVMKVMELLDGNVERKSRLYRSEALRYVFLMNNGRYIVQKIKGSKEIHECMGDNWCRRRQSRLRLYHKNYQRETWGKVLQCLSHGGLQGNEKVIKSLVKERFKSFNAMFDEIHKTQSTWVVSDEQLRSELRVSISSVMIPAYRSFWGRFKHCLDSVKQVDKYIKYQPEDIETLIDKLFSGNTASIARRR
ncbi:exocyst complex component EXO70B1-like [Senna tora]|uniref:Exocyst subunit Exo70 family protein n=1 Tax=Senna tora TaxID=362788 RepID=A0A834X3C2_9FABA|nr:exocyst complex component EXO70B1-like [Senna tora]